VVKFSVKKFPLPLNTTLLVNLTLLIILPELLTDNVPLIVHFVIIEFAAPVSISTNPLIIELLPIPSIVTGLVKTKLETKCIPLNKRIRPLAPTADTAVAKLL